MTYSPGNPGYPPAQSPGSYGGSTPSFAKSDDSASKLQLYLTILTIVVVVLGLAAYLLSFFPMFTVNADLGSLAGELTGEASFAIVAALLAALLAAASLLPKAKNYVAVVAALAVLGALLVILQTFSRPSGFSIGWALWFILACTVAQAIVAVAALLLEAGVVTVPAPRPRYEQYGQYAQYGQYGPQPGGYYGQPSGQQHAPPQQRGPQQSPQLSGYGSQYGGYSSAPSTGGFSAVGSQSGSQQGPQQGPPTPPTGFPSFGQPPSAGSGAGSQGPGNSSNHGGSNQGQQSPGQGQQSHTQQSYGQGQQQHGQGQQQSPSSPSGPTHS
ncbi:MAG TPA: DUF5336 domain-containing protein [Mycobacterium sp.]|nr:DUF5336 domain-containing protein [Mycobacterium sp.]